jgi:hypothetical protein
MEPTELVTTQYCSDVNKTQPFAGPMEENRPLTKSIRAGSFYGKCEQEIDQALRSR